MAHGFVADLGYSSPWFRVPCFVSHELLFIYFSFFSPFEILPPLNNFSIVECAAMKDKKGRKEGTVKDKEGRRKDKKGRVKDKKGRKGGRKHAG